MWRCVLEHLLNFISCSLTYELHHDVLKVCLVFFWVLILLTFRRRLSLRILFCHNSFVMFKQLINLLLLYWHYKEILSAVEVIKFTLFGMCSLLDQLSTQQWHAKIYILLLFLIVLIFVIINFNRIILLILFVEWDFCAMLGMLRGSNRPLYRVRSHLLLLKTKDSGAETIFLIETL